MKFSRTDLDHQKLQNKFCFWPWDKAFRSTKKFYELQNFTNTKRKNCPKCSFLNLMNMQTHVKINRKVAFFIEYSGTKKSKSCCHPPFHPPNFCRHSLKLLSPTLPKLMNWILLSQPPLSSDPDNPTPKFGTRTCMVQGKGTKSSSSQTPQLQN